MFSVTSRLHLGEKKITSENFLVFIKLYFFVIQSTGYNLPVLRKLFIDRNKTSRSKTGNSGNKSEHGRVTGSCKDEFCRGGLGFGTGHCFQNKTPVQREI